MYLPFSLLLWFLLAIALTSLLNSAWRISRSGRPVLLSGNLAISESSTPLRIEPGKSRRRPTKWITFPEFKVLLDQSPRDLIVIGLRADASWSPLPVTEVFVLDVAPDELMDFLKWLPSDRRAVFFGVTDLDIPRIGKSASMDGSAPFYFLNDCSIDLEAA